MKKIKTTSIAKQNIEISTSRKLINGTSDAAEQPLLSIAIPTYRRFDLLSEALTSVFRLRFDIPIEILVVDNDPDDDAIAIAAMHSFTKNGLNYYKNRVNVGMFGNWNRCLELAQGKYVTILHDDDLLEHAFAEEVNRCLGRGGSIGAALAWPSGILDERAHRPLPGDDSPLRQIQRWMALVRPEVKRKSAAHLFFQNQFTGTLGVIFDREKAIALGGFSPDWYPIADYEFWCRWTVAYGPISIRKRKVGLYRMRQNESMLPETRSAFVTRSRHLRELMISNGEVPAFYRQFLDQIQEMQRAAIEEDWRIAGQNPMSKLDSFRLIGWRVVTALLSSIASRTETRRREE